MAASLASTLMRHVGGTSVRQMTPLVTCTRGLNLHEYQSKELMQQHNVAVQKFKAATTAADAAKFAKELNVEEIVLKAQVHAGGRGKGTFDNGFKSGVHLTKNCDEVGVLAGKMLGHRLVTKQTPPGGVPVNTVMVAQALDIARETYFAILMDRDSNGPVMVGSPQGGVDIEEVAEAHPELIFKEVVDIETGVSDAQTARMAANLGFKGDQARQAQLQMKNLYAMFLAVDAVQVEINPFAETPQGEVVCFDAKIGFDDNAQFRQAAIFAGRDTNEEDPRDVQASEYGLNYIGMDGNIACLVNGAGLAMATMDIIKLHGGEPANFLDCGGGVTEKQVTQAFKLVTSDPQVKAILVNIFGGIVNCETIAKGVISAAREIDLKLPLVMRLEGTNVQEAKALVAASGLKIIMTDNLDEAAKKAVSLA